MVEANAGCAFSWRPGARVPCSAPPNNSTPRRSIGTVSTITGYDPLTLREQVDVSAANKRLDELGNLRSLTALLEKVTLFRLLNRLEDAWNVANEAVRLTRFSGNREDLLAARIVRAQVQHAQAKLPAALSELTLCADEAGTHEWGGLEAAAQLALGKVRFELAELPEAKAAFTAAVFLFERLGASLGDLESALVAISVTEKRIAQINLGR